MVANEIKVVAKSHHRNGVSGAPFDVYLFTDPDHGLMLGVDWGDESGVGFATFIVEQLAKGNISFGSNSFRGDYYAYEVRHKGTKVKNDVAAGAFFVKYKVKKEHKNGRKSTTGN